MVENGTILFSGLKKKPVPENKTKLKKKQQFFNEQNLSNPSSYSYFFFIIPPSNNSLCLNSAHFYLLSYLCWAFFRTFNFCAFYLWMVVSGWLWAGVWMKWTPTFALINTIPKCRFVFCIASSSFTNTIIVWILPFRVEIIFFCSDCFEKKSFFIISKQFILSTKRTIVCSPLPLSATMFNISALITAFHVSVSPLPWSQKINGQNFHGRTTTTTTTVSFGFSLSHSLANCQKVFISIAT